ncbi:MAG: hypothetical protein V1921_05490 [Candidatus Altiarchaeota archaeon]
MRISYRTGGGSGSQPEKVNVPADYDSILRRVNERILGPSNVQTFFKQYYQTAPSRVDVLYGLMRKADGTNTSGPERKPLNIGIALLEGRPSWRSNVDANGAKKLLEKVAQRFDLVNLKDNGYSIDEIKAVEAVVASELGVDAMQDTQRCGLPSPMGLIQPVQEHAAKKRVDLSRNSRPRVSRPVVSKEPTDYEAVADAVSKRVISPSDVTHFFREHFNTAPGRDEINDRFLSQEGRARRKPVSIAMALIKAHPRWAAGKKPEEMKSVLENMSWMTDLVDIRDEKCTVDEVKAVEAALLSELGDVDSAQIVDDRPSIKPVEGFSRPELSERRQLLAVSRSHGLTKMVGDGFFMFKRASMMANPEDAANKLVNDILNPSILDMVPGISDVFFKSNDESKESARARISEAGIRTFKAFAPQVRVAILDAIESDIDTRMRDETRNDAIQVCANMLDELPPRACAETFTEMEAVKGSLMLEVMKPENAAKAVERLLKSDNPAFVHKGFSLMNYLHKDSGDKIRKRLSRASQNQLDGET